MGPFATSGTAQRSFHSLRSCQDDKGERIDVLLTQLDVLPLRVNSVCERCMV